MFETDDDDFIPSSSANLSSIFNANLTSRETASLSYKAPKQPKPVGSNSSASTVDLGQNSNSNVHEQSQSSVILAKVITLWKLENGQNKLMGKHIVAIIGNESQKLYDIIVYQEKTNILIRQPLNESLVLYKYPKNFIGIFDIHKQFWNLNFDTFGNLESFLKAIANYKCQIIEQKSHNSDSDQVDNKINVEFSKGEPISSRTSVSPMATAEQTDTLDANSKDKILSRITKMGQQILPKSIVERKVSTELTDSETESSYSESKPSKPAAVPRKFRRNQNHDKVLIPTPLVTDNSILHSSYPANNNQMMLNPHSMVYTQPFPDYGVNNFIIAQNAELKANLGEINLKLSNILSSQSGNMDKNGNNEECDTFKSRIKCLNLKVENLTADLERSRRSFEELKKQYDGKCIEINKEKENNENSKFLLKEIERLKEELNSKETLIEIQRLKLKDFEEFYIQNEHTKENLNKEICELNLKFDKMKLKTEEYEEELKQKEIEINKKQAIECGLDKDMMNKNIKAIMNEAFKSIMGQFDESQNYNFNDIQGVILEQLKETTYSLINMLE